MAWIPTSLLWIVLCGKIQLKLIRAAREAPVGTIEEYARSARFQVLNFVWGYFPTLLLILILALGMEWAVAAAFRKKHARSA